MANFILLKHVGLVAVPDYYNEKIFTRFWKNMSRRYFKWSDFP